MNIYIYIYITSCILRVLDVFTFLASWCWLIARASFYVMTSGWEDIVPAAVSIRHSSADRRSCSAEIWTFKTALSVLSWVTSAIKLVVIARSVLTKLIVFCPLSLTVSVWTLRDSLLVSSGKFNCLSGGITFFIASDADKKRWCLSGVSSFLVDLRSLVRATHL